MKIKICTKDTDKNIYTGFVQQGKEILPNENTFDASPRQRRQKLDANFLVQPKHRLKSSNKLGKSEVDPQGIAKEKSHGMSHNRANRNKDQGFRDLLLQSYKDVL